jgi:dCMP deaminase
LEKELGFKRLRLKRTAPTPAVEKSAEETRVPSSQNIDDGDDGLHFEDAECLLSFVTANWRDRWVTTDIWDENVVDVLSRRPFFLLISIDAPVTVRWQRFKNRSEFPKRLL